jgi:hypothetical protein
LCFINHQAEPSQDFYLTLLVTMEPSSLVSQRLGVTVMSLMQSYLQICLVTMYSEVTTMAGMEGVCVCFYEMT